MFVYQGKLSWLNLAQGETFTIVLPKGVVRVDDPVYLFSQWTQTAQGVPKENWFQTILVQNLKKLPNSDDVVFTLSGAARTFVVTTEQNYSKLKVEVSNLIGQKSHTVLKREWQAQGEPATDASLRIWTGKLNWKKKAINEQAIFILPEGYGIDRPIVSSWQWTEDGSNNAKSPSFKGTTLKALGSDNGVSKFSFNNYFDITCSWNLTTEKLGVKLKDKGEEADIGELNLAAKIEHNTHTFDAVDQTLATKKELEVRAPRPQASLQRILEPLPFPKTLIETLTQSAAFLDQAGYQAIQAQNRFNLLDADFHKQASLIEALKKDKENLENQVTSLYGDLAKANANIEELEKQLAQAIADHKKKEEELNKKIQALQKHDAKDDTLIKELREELRVAGVTIETLKQNIRTLNVDKTNLKATIAALHGKISDLRTKKLELENKLKVQEEVNAALHKENAELKRLLKASEAANKSLQGELAKVKTELHTTKTTLLKTEDKLSKTEIKLGQTEGDLKSTKKTLEHTQATLKETQVELGKTQTDLKNTKDELKHTKCHLEDTHVELGHVKEELADREDDISRATEASIDKHNEWQKHKAQFNNAINKLQSKLIHANVPHDDIKALLRTLPSI